MSDIERLNARRDDLLIWESVLHPAFMAATPDSIEHRALGMALDNICGEHDDITNALYQAEEDLAEDREDQALEEQRSDQAHARWRTG